MCRTVSIEFIFHLAGFLGIACWKKKRLVHKNRCGSHFVEFGIEFSSFHHKNKKRIHSPNIMEANQLNNKSCRVYIIKTVKRMKQNSFSLFCAMERLISTAYLHNKIRTYENNNWIFGIFFAKINVYERKWKEVTEKLANKKE